MSAPDTKAILARWRSYEGQGPDDIRSLCAALDQALRRVRALLADGFITDDGVEVVLVQDVEAALDGAS